VSTDLTILPTDEGGGDDEVTTLIGDAGRSYVTLDEYPHVSVDVALDRSGSGRPDEESFRVIESDVEREVESVTFGRSAIDLVFVFDDTGSMSDEIAAMQRGAKQLTDAIDARGVDARYGLVSFKNDPELDLRLTADPNELKRAVDALQASGGGYYLEDNFGAIETALDLDFRREADTVIVDITDAPSHHRDGTPKEDIGEARLDEMLDRVPDAVKDRLGEDLVDEFVGSSAYVMDDVIEDLEARDALFVAVAPDLDDRDESIKTLAGQVGGLWTDIEVHDFDRVLERVTDLVASTYSLEYVTRFEPGDEGELRVIYDPPRGRSVADEAFVSVPLDATRTRVAPDRSGTGGGRSADGTSGGTSIKSTGDGTSGGTSIKSSGDGTSGGTSIKSSGDGTSGETRPLPDDDELETKPHPTSEADDDGSGSELPPFCPYCGTDLDRYSGISFCPDCGESMAEYS